jgi:hypothetical protein
MGERVSARDVLRLRLATQRVEPIGTADAAGTVRHLLAIQAQDFGQALWAIGVRSRDIRRSDVLAALARGEIVRTLPMRGTLHFIAPEDLRWMLELTAERSLQSAAGRFRRLGLDQQTFDRAATVATAALAGGNALGRDEFMKLLASNGIAPDGQRGYHIIFYLTQRALLCWGPPSRTQQALVLVDDWIPPAPAIPRQRALETFAARYFASHGPATERDFAWWSKLTLTDVRAAIGGLGSRLTALTLDGRDYLVATDALAEARASGSASRSGSGVHALPGFDEYLLGYQDRSLQLPSEHSTRIVPGDNGIFFPTIIAGGRVIGTWRRGTKRGAPGLTPTFFADPTSAQLAGIARATKRLERFGSDA